MVCLAIFNDLLHCCGVHDNFKQMIKIRLGGWPFVLPQKWEEVTPRQAKKLSATKPEDLKQRLEILGGIPAKANLSPDVIFAAYEIISFVEVLPEITQNKVEVGDTLKWIENDWSFEEFETARQIIVNHKDELTMALYPLAEIKDLQQNYLEAGSKALDGINRFTLQYEPFGIYEDKEPSALEELAGVDQLQAFGVYPILTQIGAKFGKYPEEIAKKSVGWVMLEYVNNFATEKYVDKLRKLQDPKSK